MKSSIIAISNQKGGVGKTTTCISLGACLAENGQPTLIIDLDSQANLTFSVGYDPDELDWTLPDILEKNEGEEIQIFDLIQPTSVRGLDIIPSDVRLAAVDQLIFTQPKYEQILTKILAPIREKYSIIIFDCPPSLSALTISALTAAQLVLVPVQCEYFSARGLMRLMDIITAVKNHTNPNLDYRLVATMFDKRNKISFQVYDQIVQNYQEHTFETIIGIDTKLKESSVVGEPIVVYAPTSRSAQAYRQLSSELISYLKIKGEK